MEGCELEDGRGRKENADVKGKEEAFKLPKVVGAKMNSRDRGGKIRLDGKNPMGREKFNHSSRGCKN